MHLTSQGSGTITCRLPSLRSVLQPACTCPCLGRYTPIRASCFKASKDQIFGQVGLFARQFSSPPKLLSQWLYQLSFRQSVTPTVSIPCCLQNQLCIWYFVGCCFKVIQSVMCCWQYQQVLAASRDSWELARITKKLCGTQTRRLCFAVQPTCLCPIFRCYIFR